MTMSNYNFSSNLDSEMFSYEYFQQADICRLCWAKEASIDLFTRRTDEPCLVEEQLVQKLLDCLSLDLRLGADTLPSKICTTCSGHVETFYMFKRFCLESDKTLREIFEKHTSELPADFSTDVKIESLTEIPEGEVFAAPEEPTNSLEDSMQLDNEVHCTNSSDQYPDTVNRTSSEDEEVIQVTLQLDTVQNPDSLASEAPEAIVDNIDSSLTSNTTPNVSIENASSTDSRDIGANRKSSRKHGTVSRYSYNNQPVEKKTTTKKQVKHKKIKDKSIAMNKDPNNTVPEFCIECKKIFKDIQQLSVHNINVHKKEDDGMTYKCYGCIRTFSTKKNRIRHETTYCHGLKDGYKCLLCDRFLPYRQVLQRHMKEHYSTGVVKVPENIFKCKRCGKCFKTRQKLTAHRSKHVQKEYVCETCGRVFSRPDYLKSHRLIHTGVKRHCCPHCPYLATQRSSLVLHLRTHSGERPYQCDMCPLRCVSKSSLSAHLRRHLGHILFKCKICPKTFGYKESLKTHIANVHECPVSHTCQYCKMSYRRKTSLNRHVRTKHHETGTDVKEQDDCKLEKEGIHNTRPTRAAEPLA